jgi:hypothetical protein
MSISPMEVTLYRCSECADEDHGGWATYEAWQSALHRERVRRMNDPEFGGDYGDDYGLGDAMVCPRCGYVHRDDDSSSVDEERRTVSAATDSLPDPGGPSQPE